MSDESTPSPQPSLRLKPRLRPDASSTPPPSIPKIAIAQTLDVDGVLAAGERKVFSAPAPEPSSDSAPAAAEAPETEEAPSKKLSLTPKLNADSKSKRFSLPAANPTSALKRLPPALAPTPGKGEDGAPQDEEDAHLGPTSYAHGDVSHGAHASEDTLAAATPAEATTAYAAEHPLSGGEPDSSESTGRSVSEDAADTDTSSAADASAIKRSDDPGSNDGEALGAPHPEADVPTRFSPPPSETGEAARFKLKPRLSAPENPPMHGGVSLPPALPSASHPAPPPGIKIVPTAPVGPSSGSLPAKVALQPRASANGTRQVRRVVVKSSKPRIVKYLLITFGILAGIGLAVGGFIVFRDLAKLEKHPSAEQPAILVPVKKANVPKTAAPKSAAGRLVEEAKAAANSQLEEIDPTSETPAKPMTPTTASKPVAAVAKSATTPAAGTTHEAAIGTAATTVAVAKTALPLEPKVAPPPSADFRALIVNLHVSGVFQGAHPRALLNGRLLNSGEILDQTLQVRFTGIDAAHKQLMFEDGAGSVMQRHY